MSTISSSTTTTTAYTVSADTTGTLVIQTGATPTTAVTVNTSGALGVGSSPSYGTSGQVLTSAGSSAVPTWTTVSGASLTTPSFTSTIGVGSATASASGAGVTFPATQSDSSNANTLDDYEEGTWTPTLPNGGTLSNVASFYTKIGRTVYIQLHLNSIAPTNNGSEFQIGSLPFTSTSTGGSFGGGCFQYCGNTNLSNFLPIITNNGNYFFFHQNSGTTATITNSTYVGLAGATKSMIVNAWYITN